MNALFKHARQKCLQWIVNHPKKFFTYSMIFLSVSFVGSLILGIFFPNETVFTIKPPALYSKSQMSQHSTVNNEKEMRKIVEELGTLKVKRDRKQLQRKDSLRIEYLFNQFQKLKNGY